MAPKCWPGLAPRSPPKHCSSGDAFILEETGGVHWPGISGRCGLHGPRQLGYGFSRWRAVWLRASGRHHDLQSDGDPASAFMHQAWRRHGTRPGAGLSRSLRKTDRLVFMDSLRDRNCRMRSGRGRWLSDRVAASFRHSVGVGLPDYSIRCATGVVSSNEGLSLH